MDLLQSAGLSVPDIILVVIILIAMPIEAELSIRYLRPRIERGVPGARMVWYGYTFIELWLITAAIIWVWLASARAWPELGLTVSGGWGMWAAWMVVAAAAVIFGLQLRAVTGGGDALKQLQDQMRRTGIDTLFIMPRTQRQYHAAIGLGVTAGITEEIIYRGFLIWALGLFMHTWLAALVSLAAFVFMHRYQGSSGLAQVTLMGAILTGLVLVSGSLYPAIVLHVLVDVFSMTITWRVRQAGVPTAT